MNHHHHRSAAKPSRRRQLIDYIGGAAFVGLLVFLFSLIVVDLIQNWKMRDWPYAEATLVERNLTVVNRSELQWEPGIAYRADYLYSYAWQGNTYHTHDQLLLTMNGSDRELWEFRNAVGTKKIVRLNPDKPGDATLKWGISWAFDIAYGSLAVALFVAGLLWLSRPARTGRR
jgi:hypothetical protein